MENTFTSLPESQPENLYDRFSLYYDLMVSTGYYDYKGYAQELSDKLPGGRRGLEVGAGTGLFLEKIAPLMPLTEFIGIDHTKEMVELAKQRLKTLPNVRVSVENLTTFATSNPYDFAFCHGGVFYFTGGPGAPLEFNSHLSSLKRNEKALAALSEALAQEAWLAISIQPPHREDEAILKQHLIYHQYVEPVSETNYRKHYVFSEYGTVLCSLHCDFYRTSFEESIFLFEKHGFKLLEIEPNDNFIYFEKQ